MTILRSAVLYAQASPAVGLKRSMEDATEPSQERAPKKARHDAQLEGDAMQADRAAAALPNHPAANGHMAAGSQEEMQQHDASHHLTEAAATSAGKARQAVQPDLALSPENGDGDTKAASKSKLQLQQPQHQPPSPVRSKQGAQDLTNAQAAAGVAGTKDVQETAKV